MTTTTYAVYQNNGSIDGTALDTEVIDDALRDDEKVMRIASLLHRAGGNNALATGKTWVVQSSALVRT